MKFTLEYALIFLKFIGMKTNLLNFKLTDFEDFFISINEKKYRAKQVFKWIYEKKASSFGEMSDLPVELRKKLGKICSLKNVKIIEKNISKILKIIFGLMVLMIG